MSLFNANKEMYALGISCLRVISLSFVFVGINMIICSCLQALNHANESLVITLARQLVLLVPLTDILAHLFGLNVAWFAFVITEVICTICAFIIWHKVERKL